MRSYYQIENAFRQAKKTDELLEILEQTDLRRLGRSYYVMNTVQNLMNDESMRGRVMGLFRKAWEAFPQERSNMISYVHRDEFWQMPEMYDYALQALIPDAASFSPYQQWNAFAADHLLRRATARSTAWSRACWTWPPPRTSSTSWPGGSTRPLKKLPAWKAGQALKALDRLPGRPV